MKLTIVVPIYNINGYLDKCLNSLTKQTYKEFDVLCVNDGSTDNSAKIIDKYTKKDKRFKRIDKKNGGLSDARNYALKTVKTKYVMFIDGDDYVEPDLVKTCIEHMENDNLDIFVFAYNQILLETNEKEIIKIGIDDGTYNIIDSPELLAYTPNAAWNKCYKTSLFVDNKIEYPFGYRYEDLGTTPKLLLEADRIGYLNKPLYNYIIDRPNNITSQIDEKMYHLLDISKSIVDYYNAKGVYRKYRFELSYLINRNLIQSLRKVVTMKNKKFVFKFIDDVFDFRKENLSISLKYEQIEYKSDYIYQSRLLSKLYYRYKQFKNH